MADLPVILMELDPQNNMAVKKTYIYANGQILAQHDGPHTASKYFYLHDRVGSIRQIIDTSILVNVKNFYTYNPFGETIESGGSLANSFMFTGQYYDSEIGEYYLRARQYDPHIARFTARDPVFGQFQEPLTLHRYLYCGNDPLNRLDLLGLDYFDFNFTYTPVGLVPGGAAGSLSGPWGFAGGIAIGGLGFTGGLMWEAGLTHKPARVASTHPYFGLSWSASPMPSVTFMKTYSLQDIPNKEKGTTGWQAAVTFSAGPVVYQKGIDLDTRESFAERGYGVGAPTVVPLSVSVFYVFDDFTYGDDDLDKAVMLGKMLNDDPSLLGLQGRYLLMAGLLDETTSSCFRDAAEYQSSY